MRSLVAVFAVLLPGMLAGGLCAQEAAAPDVRLDQMSRNFRSMNYRGVFTYEQGQKISAVRIVHAVVDGVEQERVVHLDGEQREFLRRGHPVDCVHAGDRLLRLSVADRLADRAQTVATPGPGARLGDYYAIEAGGSERVASRNGSRIRLVPRDPYRYGMTLVLDDASSLLLKSETTDGAGRVLERFQFVEVDIGADIAAAELAAETAGAHEARGHLDADRPADAAFAWTVAWLPEGFALTGRERQPDADPGHSVESQLYSDGLAVFAVFVERNATALDAAGHASQGATVAYLTPRGDGNTVTVVGEIPIATAQLIANAVNFSDQSP